MKALVLEKYKELVYKDVSDPGIKSNEVLIRVIAYGICVTDVQTYKRDGAFAEFKEQNLNKIILVP
jgi:threonine dehydrogenase-like Zn-dependent dehydrogenase